MEEDTASLQIPTKLKEGPEHLYQQYVPLTEVYAKHNQPLPLTVTGIKDSNSEAIIKALKSLQDKIRHLELERAVTAEKFKELSKQVSSTSREATRDEREMDNSSSSESDLGTPPLATTPSQLHNVDINIGQRIDSLDNRFALQSKELKLMKQRLKLAETTNAKLQRDETSTSTPPQVMNFSAAGTEERLLKLEDEQSRLTSKQLLTTTKLDDLEGKVLEDQWEKRQAQHYYDSRQLLSDVENHLPTEGRRMKKGVRKKTKPQSSQHHQVQLPLTKAVPGIHYHLNMKDVPFVVGKNTGPSHSVTANYQQVISLMKYHSPLLCGIAAANVAATNTVAAANKKKSPKTQTVNSKRKPSSNTSCEELKGLLMALEEEYGRLTFEHQELVKAYEEHQQVSSSSTPQYRLEVELDRVIKQIEGKLEQIQIVKKLLNNKKKLHEKGHHKSNTSKGTNKPSSSSRTHCDYDVDIHKDSLHVLRKMKRLQNTLQSDDLSWN